MESQLIPMTQDDRGPTLNMKTSAETVVEGAFKDDFLELVEQIRKATPMPSDMPPVAGQRHYQAVIYSYLETLLA